MGNWLKPREQWKHLGLGPSLSREEPNLRESSGHCRGLGWGFSERPQGPGFVSGWAQVQAVNLPWVDLLIHSFAHPLICSFLNSCLQQIIVEHHLYWGVGTGLSWTLSMPGSRTERYAHAPRADVLVEETGDEPVSK